MIELMNSPNIKNANPETFLTSLGEDGIKLYGLARPYIGPASKKVDTILKSIKQHAMIKGYMKSDLMKSIEKKLSSKDQMKAANKAQLQEMKVADKGKGKKAKNK